MITPGAGAPPALVDLLHFLSSVKEAEDELIEKYHPLGAGMAAINSDAYPEDSLRVPETHAIGCTIKWK